MKKLLSSLLPLAALFLFVLLTSCEKEGACEKKTVISGAGYSLYSCENSATETTCDIASKVYDEVYHHPGKSCASLGYVYKTSNKAIIHASEDGKSPGANGSFTNESAGGGCAGGSYEGPLFDIQIDSQCQNAYAARCAGQDAVADASCSIYKSYQSNDSSIPDCPYCN